MAQFTGHLVQACLPSVDCLAVAGLGKPRQPRATTCAKYVIHTVGPVWRGGNDDEVRLLASGYRKSLEVAAELHLRSTAFAAVGTGIYGFPKWRAAEIAVKETTAYDGNIETVVFVCFDSETAGIYRELLSLLGFFKDYS